MVRDVFVSHASDDSALAVQVCELLEQRGLTCWIAPRDVGAGVEWDEAILDAIEQSRAFLLILSSHANQSSFVKNELNRAFSGGKPIVTFRIEEVTPGRSLELYLARHHWTDGFPPPLEPKVDQLASSLNQLLGPSGPGEVPKAAARVAPSISRPAARNSWQWIAATALLGVIAMALPTLRHLRESPPAELRTDIVTPVTDLPLHFALSPDGQNIAFVAKGDGATRLWVRSLASATAQQLPNTEGASAPFWSPDSRSIGFFAEGSLMRTDLRGTQPQVLASVRRDGTLGGTWSPSGVILFGEGQTDPLHVVSETGGSVKDVVAPDAERAWLAMPQFLPDGEQFLFVARAGPAPGIYLGALDGRTPVRLTAESDFAPFAYHPSGWLLWLRARVLTAQRVDLKKADLAGQPLTLANSVDSVSVSTTGLVAYRTSTVLRHQLAWVDRAGAVQNLGEPDYTIDAPRVSPDGRRLALSREAQGNEDVWLLEGGRSSRITFENSADGLSVWSPDGSKIVFASGGNDGMEISQKASSGAGAVEKLLPSDRPQFPSSWSADGRFLMYFAIKPTSGADIWVLPMTGDRKPFSFLATPKFEVWGQFSPNGKWVAYQSNESGRNEIYVRPFVVPDGADPRSQIAGQWQISTDGGIHPMWRPDGKELYFLNPAGDMMAATIEVNRSVVVPGRPMSLFQSRIAGGGQDRTQGRQYDVARDGRFLINTELDAGGPAPITLIQNWNPDAGK